MMFIAARGIPLIEPCLSYGERSGHDSVPSPSITGIHTTRPVCTGLKMWGVFCLPIISTKNVANLPKNIGFCGPVPVCVCPETSDSMTSDGTESQASLLAVSGDSFPPSRRQVPLPAVHGDRRGGGGGGMTKRRGSHPSPHTSHSFSPTDQSAPQDRSLRINGYMSPNRRTFSICLCVSH